MNAILRCPAMLLQTTGLSRTLSSSSVLSIKEWRANRGLPINRNAEGILTDGPDYTFLDGRPTPLLRKQMKRVLKQRDFATKMVELCSELEFAKTRHQQLQDEKEQQRQQIITNRLKPKGQAMMTKK